MTTPAVAQRAACPACGAATRLGDPWCTLCYADLSPAPAAPVADAAQSPTVQPAAVEPAVDEVAAQIPEPVRTTQEPVSGAASDSDDPTTPSSPLDAVTMPCPACETPVPVLVGACPVCGTDMMAPLRGADVAHQSQFVREMMAMSRAARLSMAAGLAVALLIVIFAVSAIA